MVLLENKDTNFRNHEGKGRIDLTLKKCPSKETINKIK